MKYANKVVSPEDEVVIASGFTRDEGLIKYEKGTCLVYPKALPRQCFTLNGWQAFVHCLLHALRM